MPWALSDSKTQRDLERTFKRHGVAFDTPGFYDGRNFLERERRDPTYLEMYARYVESKAYDEDYLADARRKIDVATEALRVAVTNDGRQGACVDVSGMLARMLDRLGVWNYFAKTSLTIDFPTNSGFGPHYFWTFDYGSFVAPHAVVVAPPYYIVDVTVGQQAYNRQQTLLIPKSVKATEFEAAEWTADDLANPSLLADLRARGISFKDFMNHQTPGMASVLKLLPPRRVMFNETWLKYVIVAVGGTVEPLEGITGYKPCGRLALEIFEQDVLPKLKEFPGLP